MALLGPAGAFAKGPLTWSAPAQIDLQPAIEAGSIYSISCPSAALCVAGGFCIAVGANGVALTGSNI